VAFLLVVDAVVNMWSASTGGPFAWDGMFSFRLALAAFAGWILVIGVLLMRAVKRQGVGAL